MNILFFGIYDPKYSRNRILISGLGDCGVDVVECNVSPRAYPGLKKYVELFRQARRFRGKNFDYVIVGFPGHSVMWLAKILFRKKIIFDAFLSLYDSNVFDRKIYSKWSFGGVKDWILDWYSVRLADVVLLDTFEHINYFSRTFGIKKEKFIRVFIGADDSVFYPRTDGETTAKSAKAGEFIVHFHGMFIPLQGIEFIIDAAAKLQTEPIRFNIIGKGQMYQKFVSKARELRLENVHFMGIMPLEKIPDLIALSDICLGIFGMTSKTGRVIPNKVYEYIAMKKPVITADTPAIREVFEDRKNVLLCRVSDSEDLAEKILFLKNNPSVQRAIAAGAHDVFFTRLRPKELALQLLADLNKS